MAGMAVIGWKGLEIARIDWTLQEFAGHSGKWLGSSQNFLKCLERAGKSWKWLEMHENGQRLLELALNCWKWLEITGIAGNGWKWLEMA